MKKKKKKKKKKKTKKRHVKDIKSRIVNGGSY